MQTIEKQRVIKLKSHAHKWTLLARTKGGHRFFMADDTPSMIGIADQSGDTSKDFLLFSETDDDEYDEWDEKDVDRYGTPEDTEDGILWLDFTRPIEIGEKGGANIPYVDEDNKRGYVHGYMDSALALLKVCPSMRLLIMGHHATVQL
jgi:hypothetical protein